MRHVRLIAIEVGARAGLVEPGPAHAGAELEEVS